MNLVKVGDVIKLRVNEGSGCSDPISGSVEGFVRSGSKWCVVLRVSDDRFSDCCCPACVGKSLRTLYLEALLASMVR